MSEVGKSLLRGAQEALAYAKGQRKGAKIHLIKVPHVVDVRAIREKLNMTRPEFCESYSFSLRTVEKWEQGVRQPAGAARAFLTVIDRNPKSVELALRESSQLENITQHATCIISSHTKRTNHRIAKRGRKSKNK